MQSELEKAARGFMELFVNDNGSQPGLSLDGIDPIDLTDRYVALEAALSAAEPSVAVKDLRWDGGDARSPTGTYRVQRLDDKWEPLHNGYYMLPKMGGVVEAFGTEDEAKAHCQKHYDAAIRSALTAQVQDVVVPEGWQLVPKEPTYKMLLAGSFVDWGKYPDKKEAVRDVWNAMNRNADNSAAPAKQEG